VSHAVSYGLTAVAASGAAMFAAHEILPVIDQLLAGLRDAPFLSAPLPPLR
jgi:hypothetical protein